MTVQRIAVGLFFVLFGLIALLGVPIPEWVMGLVAVIAGIAVWMAA